MKHSYTYLNSSSLKRSKSINYSTEKPISTTLDAIQSAVEQTRNKFLTYFQMPPILFKHQLYSLSSNSRTVIDSELQDMFNHNRIRLFHSDFGIFFMFTNDYFLLVEQQLYESNLSSLSIEKNRLKQRFIHDLLPKIIRLSVDKCTLQDEFDLSSNDIHLLIQFGLLLPKQSDQYWFSIPNLAPFIESLQKARKNLMLILSRRTYNEMPMSELRLRNTKKTCILGFDYHIHDVIGANLAHVIDTPTGLIVKIGREKV